MDRPPFHILRNEELLEATHLFDTGKPVRIHHLSPTRSKRFFAAAEKALALPQDEWPVFVHKTRVRPTPEEEMRFKALKKKRDDTAAQLSLIPAHCTKGHSGSSRVRFESRGGKTVAMAAGDSLASAVISNCGSANIPAAGCVLPFRRFIPEWLARLIGLNLPLECLNQTRIRHHCGDA